MKKILKFLFSRMVAVGALIALQALILILLIWKLSNYFVYVYAFFMILSMVMVLWIVSKKANPSVKIPWVIIIMMFPIFGGLFYVLFGGTRIPKNQRRKMNKIVKNMVEKYPDSADIIKELENIDEHIAMQFNYVNRQSGASVYKNTTGEYLELGEVKFEKMKEELEKAKHFIFMEYFIIQEGVMWNSILEILERKVKEGVDVRVMYDDIGCLQTLPYRYNEILESKGIKCVVFNPFKPSLSVGLHNRDHRKITVIDGYVGFTGGVNLADEYINEYEKHGHWKDCGVMLKGEAVWNLTVLFLGIWNYYRDADENYDRFKPHEHHKDTFESDGYVQPYGDTPLDDEYLSESVYLNMINNATRYLYINTPYFIVDNELVTALTLAAKRGVDVRIVTPHIADKWYVHLITESYYHQLIDGGVKIYEYTPGFIHSKTFVADDELCVIGTINMDYRSLYHHYECGALMYRNKAVVQLKEDFLSTLKVCQLVTKEDCIRVPYIKRIIRGLLKIISPLM